jgi:lysine-ketoglutarate reductase/saccharopine dehydrogenase-like protein (TIGR00300 family)
MCCPDYYTVEYVINPWMEGNVHRVAQWKAAAQWERLYAFLEERADIELIEPQPGLPDMVFTANGAFIAGNRVLPGRFYHGQRRREEEHFKNWFGSRNYEIVSFPEDVPFEGAGDAFLDDERKCLWAAYGERTDLAAHPLLAAAMDIEVVSLRLTDPRFYHLDTCFCLPGKGYLIYYPEAFDRESRHRIEQRVPEALRIAVSEEDALAFACNAVVLENQLIVNQASEPLRMRLEECGFDTVEIELTEFIKSGGGAKCLILDLDAKLPRDTSVADSVVTREMSMEGHLIDSGLLDRALEICVEGGGTFRIDRFDLGRRRQTTSSATMRIAAPSEAQLERIAMHLLELGATVAEPDPGEAQLEMVVQSGVAPEGFYATTIFPTEVRHGGAWIHVGRQRMDAVIVVDTNSGAASCVLPRNLSPGDTVVVGSRGIRALRASTEKARRERLGFAFMESEVSSERRVDIVVDRVAWEMRRVKERGGKIVVVPGPVVIHTGAGVHLAWLISHGYVHALLGGNAIAVHDIEQAMLGTSLGISLERGAPVRGGHRHHLAAINEIRRCGGIRAAVEQGVLKRGVMFECVRCNVPFSLAGSIRDDGPLPDTRMDLLEAQAEYASLLEGAEMILMFSSMLHSIGVGNMTPAGVRIVCVDINPAVVTKLADRGSVESKGIVTDVGLFLRLLADKLQEGEVPQGVS